MKKQYLYFLLAGLVIGFVSISQAVISWPATPVGEPDNGLFMTYIGKMLVNSGVSVTDGKVKKALTANTLGSGTMLVSGGNVGIGTPSPQAKLDVNGTVRTTALQITTGSSSGYILVGNGSGTTSWQPNNYRLKVKSLGQGTSAVQGKCVAMEDDTVECWGYNGHGQVGVGDTTQRNLPSNVNITGVQEVYEIGYSNFALMKDGSIYAWGYNGYGELGVGDTTNRNIPTKIPEITNAIEMGFGVSQGSYDFACALLADGTVKCWGYNGYGQVGDGTNTNKNSPTDVVGLSNVTQIRTTGAGNGGHTCALISDGSVKCWGYNGYGQIGDGTTTDRWVPTTVSGLTGVRDLYVRDQGTCAVLTDNVTLKCWGLNNYGQLGVGDRTNRLVPTVAPTGGGNIKSMSFSKYDYFSSYVLFTDGTVRSTGYNGYGQLGHGDTTARTSFTAIATLSNVKKIVNAGCGSYLGACALLNDGTMKCWGYNGYGTIGDGTTTTNYLPQKTLGLSNVVDINMYGFSNVYWTCALLSDGSVRCWGYNGTGQLGQGDTYWYATPVSVKNLNAD